MANSPFSQWDVPAIMVLAFIILDKIFVRWLQPPWFLADTSHRRIGPLARKNRTRTRLPREQFWLQLSNCLVWVVTNNRGGTLEKNVNDSYQGSGMTRFSIWLDFVWWHPSKIVPSYLFWQTTTKKNLVVDYKGWFEVVYNKIILKNTTKW